jgi:hypothetical protein
MRSRVKLSSLILAATGLVAGLAYVVVLGAPRRQAVAIANLVKKRDWAGVYQSQSMGRFAIGWSQKSFVQFAKTYIEPHADWGTLRVEAFDSEVKYLPFQSVLLNSKSTDRGAILQVSMMPLTPRSTFTVFGSQVALRWEYMTMVTASTMVQQVAHCRYPKATKTKHHIDDPAEYEFLLAEGDNLRKMGCERFYVGSKKDDIAYQIESIEEHARLYKTARNLVPIAAKYGRTMKYPPTASELAMK